MVGIELSPTAQHWIVVLLVWIGFSALVALVVRVVLPLRRPSSAAGTIAVGIVGTAIGLLVLSFISRAAVNPISPAGFAAAAAGTFATVIVYQILWFWAARTKAKEAAEELKASGEELEVRS